MSSRMECSATVLHYAEMMSFPLIVSFMKKKVGPEAVTVVHGRGMQLAVGHPLARCPSPVISLLRKIVFNAEAITAFLFVARAESYMKQWFHHLVDNSV